MKHQILLSTVLASLTASVCAQNRIKCDLDPLLDLPNAFSMSQDGFEKTFGPGSGAKNTIPRYKWLTKNRDRAVFMARPFSNVTTELSILGGQVPCNEATVDFSDSKINGINLSIYNRADGGNISQEDFDSRFKLTGQKVGELLGVRPLPRKADPRQGLLTEGWIWSSSTATAVLEKNPEADQGDFQFLRLRVAPAGATGPIANSMTAGNRSSVRKSDLPRNVFEENGEVIIKGIPMVDQGPKGYCVVASTQRLFEYYGIPCDQHQIAQVVDSDVEQGTSSIEIIKALGKLDYRFKTRFDALAVPFNDGRLYSVRVRSGGNLDRGSEFDSKDFEKTITRLIDDGIPLLWSLQLGKYPEEPSISLQAGGGHMRMIIGYNTEQGKIIFTDSWGAGHERKKMKISDAFKATTGLYTMIPTVN